MNEILSALFTYLNQLTVLHNSDVNVIGELNATMQAINKELVLDVRQGCAK